MIDLSETFYIFLVTSIIGLIVGITHTMYKSKCRKVACCGLSIDRDTEDEMKLDILRPQTPDQHV